jgi:large subunit ribosomal protein L17
MRHGKKFNHLSRKAPHRKAMLANMACSLIEHKRVNTTVAKAKALQKYIEPLITKSKTDSTHSRRVVFSYLKNKHAVSELFREISSKVADRPGGYTRILKTGFRLGDNAQMCFIELVDYNENMLKETKKKSSRKRRGGGAKKTETKAAVPAVEETVEAPTEADTKAEVVEETAEAKVEETTETVEEPKAEEKVEEPKAEAKEEAAPEEKEEKKEDDSDKEEKKEE